MIKKRGSKPSPFLCAHRTYSPDWLKSLRAHRGLTQSQASKLCGISQAAWSQWENANTLPDKCCRRLLDLIANATI